MARTPSGDKERQLLDAATRLFAEKGFHQTTVQEVAAAAGVATGTFYLYFSSKEALFHALIQSLYQEVMRAAQEARRRADGDPIGKLTASIETGVRVFARRKELAQVVLFQSAGADPAFGEQMQRVHQALAELVAEDLAEARAAGLIPDQDMTVSSLALVGTFYEVVMNWLAQGVPADIEAAIPGLVRFNLRGLGVGRPWEDSARG